MAVAASAPLPISLGVADRTYGARFQWLVPLMIGLSAPLIFATIVLPTLIDDARPLIAVVLSSFVILCGGAATISLILRGDAVGAVVNAAEGTVDVYFENMFATQVQSFPFSDVADFHAQERRDRDGYSYTGANLVTAAGRTIEILASLSPDEISAARRVIGVRGRQR